MENVNEEYLNSLSLYELHHLIEIYDAACEQHMYNKVVFEQLKKRSQVVTMIMARKLVEIDEKAFGIPVYKLVRKK